ncbi:hypothetical protein [Sphingobium yanoikuyae]|uniref:hypothetical protein n=1 Tax=Sphingobium yanoikuyae TaxID=13690 RepID=UPI000F7E9F1C
MQKNEKLFGKGKNPPFSGGFGGVIKLAGGAGANAAADRPMANRRIMPPLAMVCMYLRDIGDGSAAGGRGLTVAGATS